MTIETLRTAGEMPIEGQSGTRFPPWPVHSEAEITAVARVLRSGRTNQWTGGDVARFEAAFGELVGRSSLAAANGTLALDLCLRGLGIGEGDEVLVPARSYLADVAAPVLVGGTTSLVDVDSESGNTTVETLESGRTERTTAAIVVHVAGWPCDMRSIMKWAEAHHVLVIEDCAQAHGARIGTTHVGAFGHAAAFSFCQDKIISTGGEGGMACFRDQDALDRAWSWRDHGKVRAGTDANHWPRQAGSNYRRTGMQAAIGLQQVGRLMEWTEARTANAWTLRSLLADVPWLSIPFPREGVQHGLFMLCGVVDPTHGIDRDAVVDRLRTEFPVRSGRVMGVDRRTSCSGGSEACPVATMLAEQSLLLPVHPTAGPPDMERLAAAIRAAGS